MAFEAKTATSLHPSDCPRCAELLTLAASGVSIRLIQGKLREHMAPPPPNRPRSLPSAPGAADPIHRPYEFGFTETLAACLAAMLAVILIIALWHSQQPQTPSGSKRPSPGFVQDSQ